MWILEDQAQIPQQVVYGLSYLPGPCSIPTFLNSDFYCPYTNFHNIFFFNLSLGCLSSIFFMCMWYMCTNICRNAIGWCYLPWSLFHLFFSSFFETRFLYVALTSCSWTQRSTCLSLPSSRVKGMCLDLVVNNKLSTCSFFEIYLLSFSIRVIGPLRISWRYFLLIYILEIWEELVQVSLGINKDSCIQDVLLRFSSPFYKMRRYGVALVPTFWRQR